MTAYFIPGCRDVLHVSALLALTPLPLELIDIVLEHAEYWPRITARTDDADSEPLTLAQGRIREHVRLLRIQPICSGAADEGQYIHPTANERNVYRRPEMTLANNDLDDEGHSGNGYVLSGLWNGARDLLRKFATSFISSNPSPASSSSSNSVPETDSSRGSRAKYYADISPTAIMEPRGKHPVRRIIWKIRSHDQGWGGEGGDVYENSWTGFRGSVQRFVPSSENDEDVKEPDQYASAVYLKHFQENAERRDRPEPGIKERDSNEVWSRGGAFFKETQIQLNRRAERDWKDHCVVWDCRDDIDRDAPEAVTELRKLGRGMETGDGSFVRALSRGDMIELWSFAFFPGWANHVQTAEVTVEFAL